jgi:hypothetical protein
LGLSSCGGKSSSPHIPSLPSIRPSHSFFSVWYSASAVANSSSKQLLLQWSKPLELVSATLDLCGVCSAAPPPTHPAPSRELENATVLSFRVSGATFVRAGLSVRPSFLVLLLFNTYVCIPVCLQGCFQLFIGSICGYIWLRVSGSHTR